MKQECYFSSTRFLFFFDISASKAERSSAGSVGRPPSVVVFVRREFRCRCRCSCRRRRGRFRRNVVEPDGSLADGTAAARPVVRRPSGRRRHSARRHRSPPRPWMRQTFALMHAVFASGFGEVSRQVVGPPTSRSGVPSSRLPSRPVGSCRRDRPTETEYLSRGENAQPSHVVETKVKQSEYILQFISVADLYSLLSTSQFVCNVVSC